MHESHHIRTSDASSFDFICDYCGATDRAGSELINEPCPGVSLKDAMLSTIVCANTRKGDHLIEIEFGPSDRDYDNRQVILDHLMRVFNPTDEMLAIGAKASGGTISVDMLRKVCRAMIGESDETI